MREYNRENIAVDVRFLNLYRDLMEYNSLQLFSLWYRQTTVFFARELCGL